MTNPREDGSPVNEGPPQLARPAVLRERLLERLTQRWVLPVTVLTAGPGFGKTTLLVQSVGENRLDPRGADCWVSCRSQHHLGAALATSVVEALGERALHGGATGDSGARITELMRSYAPAHVCLILDDVHLIERESAGARLLEELLDDLPANGHVVFAGRSDPPVSLARRRAAGLVNDLVEADLTFTDVELRAFAALRVATPGSIEASGGWPALAELMASTSRRFAEEFLWDEVLARFDEPRRRGLALLHALGGADDELLSAAMGTPTDVHILTRFVPMAAVTEAGWATVHDLWAPALNRVLSSDDRQSAQLRAAMAARDRGDFALAVRLFASADAVDEVRAIARRVCADSHPLAPAEVLSDWHTWLVARGQTHSAETALLAGACRKPTDPLGSVPFFELAQSRFAAVGETEGEAAAIFHLGHIAWWHEDYDLMARLLQRCTELAEVGSPLAASIVTLGPLVIAEVLGDSDGVIGAARTSSRDHQHPEIVPITDYLEARAHLTVGDPSSALAPARRAWAAATPTMKPPAEFELLSCQWALGEEEAVMARVDTAIAELEEVAWLHNRAANGAQAALWCCLAGDSARASAFLASASLVRNASGSWARALVGLAEVMLAIDRGEEGEAARLLHDELRDRPLDDPAVARSHRAWLAVSYVLAPATREVWDKQDLRGTLAVARECASAIAALRDGTGANIAQLRNVDVRVVRPQLPTSWLAELAIALVAGGAEPTAEELLAGRNHRGIREVLRSWSKCSDKQTAAAASGLLASRAAPPAHSLRLGVLGPLVVEFDGRPNWPPQLNRKAVRDLLLLLIEYKRLSRARIRALLWPDLDDDDARNNLRVTLSYLTQALQPERRANEPSYYFEDIGDDLRFRPDAVFGLDVTEFDDALRRAEESEKRGAVSLALEQLERATLLYRGDYLTAASDGEWADAPRERLRLRFVKASVRAGELALAGGELDRASELALRAIAVDRWCEAARRLLAEACLVGGDRSGALRALDGCAAVLDDLGVEPEAATRMLARRVGYTRFDDQR